MKESDSTLSGPLRGGLNPLVTIAIPTYDRLHYLKEAVGSALAQTYRNIEILIGDDGSDASLREWCEGQAKARPQIRYQKNERNLGLAGNWNALAAAARGEFLVIIGDDDRLLPDFVRSCVSSILPDGTLVFSNHYLIDHEGRRLQEESLHTSIEYGRSDLRRGWLEDAEACAWRNAIPISASLFRVADAKALRFKEDLNNPEIELFIRLARLGGKFFFLPEYLCEYRSHSKSATESEGLKSERLVKYLIGMEVRPEVEQQKAEFLSSLMVNAVSRYLLLGDVANARRLLNNTYYPKAERTRQRGVAQVVCAYLPSVIGCAVYRAIWSIKNREHR